MHFIVFNIYGTAVAWAKTGLIAPLVIYRCITKGCQVSNNGLVLPRGSVGQEFRQAPQGQLLSAPHGISWAPRWVLHSQSWHFTSWLKWREAPRLAQLGQMSGALVGSGFSSM